MQFTQPLHRNLQRNPERVMSVCGPRSHTVRQVVDRVARLAGALRQLGVRAGDRVAMLALNSDRYLAYCYAVPWAGATLNPCNIRWSVKENAYALADCGAAVLIVDDAFAGMGCSLLNEVPSLHTLIYAGDGETPAGMLNYESLIAHADAVADAGGGGDQLLGVFYTGGTTGFPKGVMLSHQAFWSSQLAISAEVEVARHAVMLRAAPMFHLADMAAAYVGVLRDVTHVFLPAFHPQQVIEMIARHRVEVVMLVPTMIQMVLHHPALREHDLTSLRTLMYGASPIQEQVVLDLLALLPDLRMYQAYGQTEAAPLITLLGPDDHTPQAAARGLLRSCGRPGLSVEVRVVDASGAEVPRGEVGEVAVRGPNMMDGYWNKPEQTAVALPGDGWLRTGDCAYMDAEGYLFIVDRLKDMIVTGGENVYSAEVENALASHADVAMCAVIGIPDPRWGETVHAVVVPKPGRAPEVQELIAHCHANIAAYKAPSSIELRANLPISGAGKVLKTELRAPFWKDRERRVA